MLSDGHLPIEDVPGIGKTMLARSLARLLGVEFTRVQFTPDMLPSLSARLSNSGGHHSKVRPIWKDRAQFPLRIDKCEL
ncbi:MAG: AAA family ATPase [Chloroflexi bacterium]|nr:AAA family ATPase [Chloroflexota bacterium]